MATAGVCELCSLFAIFFASMEDNHNISDKFKIGMIRPQTAELAALERLKKNP